MLEERLEPVDYLRKNTIYTTKSMKERMTVMLQVQNVRLVWFSNELALGTAVSLFESLFKCEADSVSSNRTPSPQNPFVETASGKVDQFQIEVQRQIGRIDLIISPESTGEPKDGMPFDLLDFEPTIEFVLSSIGKGNWFPACFRVAMVTTSIELQSNLLEAQKKFSSFIGYDLSIPDSSDQFLQVNGRTKFGDAQCNRIMQVSVVVIQGVQITVGAGGGHQSMQSEHNGLNVVFDFNSVPNGDLLSEDVQRELFLSFGQETVKARNVNSLLYLRSDGNA